MGAVLYSPSIQATPANTEAAALLCRWAFEQGYRRVEWKCNSQNERSKAAALRIGFTFEGIFRNHMVVAGNRSRDTAWYSIVDSEWEARSRTLAEWLTSDAPVTLYARRKVTLSSLMSME
jgi:RimJ/RimL family protein N-acetyltransferase